MAKLDQILDKDQRTRFHEIELQVEGARAMLRPEIAEKLGLSDDQRQSIEQVVQRHAADMRPPRPPQDGEEGRPPAPPSPDAMRRAHEQVNREAMAVLTEGQRKTWKSMTGKPFHMEMRPPRPGGE